MLNKFVSTIVIFRRYNKVCNSEMLVDSVVKTLGCIVLNGAFLLPPPHSVIYMKKCGNNHGRQHVFHK